MNRPVVIREVEQPPADAVAALEKFGVSTDPRSAGTLRAPRDLHAADLCRRGDRWSRGDGVAATRRQFDDPRCRGGL